MGCNTKFQIKTIYGLILTILKFEFFDSKLSSTISSKKLESKSFIFDFRFLLKNLTIMKTKNVSNLIDMHYRNQCESKSVKRKINLK